MLHNILSLEGVQTLERTALTQVKGGNGSGSRENDEHDGIVDTAGQEDFGNIR